MPGIGECDRCVFVGSVGDVGITCEQLKYLTFHFQGYIMSNALCIGDVWFMYWECDTCVFVSSAVWYHL